MTIATVALAEPASRVASGHVRVLFFGRIADVCGRSLRVAIPGRGCALEDLKARIAQQVDGGEDALGEPCIRVAIDQVMTGGDVWVTSGQDVAFLSAFSGG